MGVQVESVDEYVVGRLALKGSSNERGIDSASGTKIRASQFVLDRAKCRATSTSNMPKYHFDLVDSRTVADEGGQELPDDIKAMDVGEEIARRLAQERPELKHRHYSILVSNEEGEEICRLPLDIIH